MTKASEAAEAALKDWREAFREGGYEPNLARYENGWIVISCRPDRMMFPTRYRRADLERMTKAVRFRNKKRMEGAENG